MVIDIVLRLSALRAGVPYHRGGHPQTEAEYDKMITYPDTEDKPTWTEVLSLGNVELDEIILPAKRQDLEAELLRRVQVAAPAITSMDMLEWEREKWLSILPAARNPTDTFTTVLDNYAAARDAWILINTLTEAQIAAYKVKTDPAWPAE